MAQKLVPALIIAGLFAGIFMIFAGGKTGKSHIVDVKLPALSEASVKGQAVFRDNCSQCHGGKAQGTQQGPPLIHKYYEPNHHADGAFYRAATHGVISHHWRFGNMPPIRTVTTEDMSKIISFVREVQKANGIF